MRLVMYTQQHCEASDDGFKFGNIWYWRRKCCTWPPVPLSVLADTVFGYLVQITRASRSLVILDHTQSQSDTVLFMTPGYMFTVFHGSDLDFSLVLLVVEPQKEIQCDVLAKELPCPFLFFYWSKSTPSVIPRRKVRQPIMTAGIMQRCCVRVLPKLTFQYTTSKRGLCDDASSDARSIAVRQSWNTDTSDLPGRESIPPQPLSPTPYDDTLEKERWEAILARPDTWSRTLSSLSVTLFRETPSHIYRRLLISSNVPRNGSSSLNDTLKKGSEDTKKKILDLDWNPKDLSVTMNSLRTDFQQQREELCRLTTH